ncbi:MAG TPA: 2-phospho-L-lactate guanylyltransferase [Actinomycetota bacterium]|nr:2-phospho-L-lactate guanylyltransferase [Actinomycetota bacterium]
MRVIAVPVKSLAGAKRRVAPDLTPLERGALTLAMLEDVLDAAQAVTGWQTWVVSPDEVVLEIAVRRGATSVPEEKPPLASAIRQVERLATEREVDALAVLPGDLPLITTEALTAALRTLGPVVLARSHDEAGTNLLLRRPPKAIPARFGPQSFRRHLDQAEARGLPAAVVDRRELSFDLDVPSDILTLLATGRRGRARQVCLEMDLRERLTAQG